MQQSFFVSVPIVVRQCCSSIILFVDVLYIILIAFCFLIVTCDQRPRHLSFFNFALRRASLGESRGARASEHTCRCITTFPSWRPPFAWSPAFDPSPWMRSRRWPRTARRCSSSRPRRRRRRPRCCCGPQPQAPAIRSISTPSPPPTPPTTTSTPSPGPRSWCTTCCGTGRTRASCVSASKGRAKRTPSSAPTLTTSRSPHLLLPLFQPADTHPPRWRQRRRYRCKRPRVWFIGLCDKSSNRYATKKKVQFTLPLRSIFLALLTFIVAGTSGGLVSSVVTASFFHVCNEKVYDLLATHDENDNNESAPLSSAIHTPLQVVEIPASLPAEGWCWSPAPAATGGDGNGTGDASAASAVVDMGAGVGLRALSQVLLRP